jgi:hypothetical protein
MAMCCQKKARSERKNRTLILNEYKSFAKIPQLSQKPANPVEPSPQIQFHQKKWRPQVVNSTHIKWKPVDRVAARVVAKAIGYNQPPRPAPKFMADKADKLSSPPQGGIKTKVQLTEEGYRAEHFDRNSADHAILSTHEKDVKKRIDVTEDLTERCRELTAAIQYLVTEIKGPWSEYNDFIKMALTTVREQRISVGSETRLLMGALKEVRQFFLEESYETEIQRLHEFIDLCERLRALKESGFLDIVADTMLRLSERGIDAN